MKKKYIIAVVVTALLWGGFMFYRYNKKEEDGTLHHAKMGSQLIEIAKKSPKAGLSHVGEALQAYYKDNKEYPRKLMDLYPKYIDNQIFLTQIDWHYEPRGADFFLSKTVVIDNKRMVASMDKSLRPESERGMMVAAPTPPPTAAPIVAPGAETKKAEISDSKRLEMARENFLNALKEGRFSVTSVSTPERDEEQLLAKVMPRILSVYEGDGEINPEAALGESYLVWKETNGALGFGNTQYPQIDSLAIFIYGRWYHIKMPDKKTSETAPVETIQEKIEKNWFEMVLANLDDDEVVWKEENGAYGFGDLQDPGRKHIAVFQVGEWVYIHNPPLPIREEASGDAVYEDRRTTAQIAEEMAKSWLVWKDKTGTYGFGDHQYPEGHTDSVYQEDGWVKIEQTALSAHVTRDDVPVIVSDTENKDAAALFANECLIWKDKNGTVGFGNIQYPEKGIASVFQSDEWIEVGQNEYRWEPKNVSDEAPGDEKITDAGSSILNGPFLVWKTEAGTLGFGNLEYPKSRGISHIQVDGSWEPVAN